MGMLLSFIWFFAEIVVQPNFVMMALSGSAMVSTTSGSFLPGVLSTLISSFFLLGFFCHNNSSALSGTWCGMHLPHTRRCSLFCSFSMLLLTLVPSLVYQHRHNFWSSAHDGPGMPHSSIPRCMCTHNQSSTLILPFQTVNRYLEFFSSWLWVQ